MNTEQKQAKIMNLYSLAFNDNSQLSVETQVNHFQRLVDGDLAHIGEALIQGKAIRVHGFPMPTQANARANAYTIKEQPFLMGADGVRHHYPEPVEGGAYLANPLMPMLWNIKDRLTPEEASLMSHDTKENAILHAQAIKAACRGSVEGVVK